MVCYNVQKVIFVYPFLDQISYPDLVCVFLVLIDLPVCVITAMMTRCRLLSLWFALLVILTEMIFALVVEAAVFINSNEVTISPFNFCSKGQNGKILSCQPVPSTTVYLCLYVPVVLVPFALLSLLLSGYGEEDSSVLRLSMWCQAAASALSLLGLVWFVGLHWAYASQSAMTVYYYFCVLVTAELAVTTYLSYVLWRELDHQQQQSMLSTSVDDCNLVSTS